MRSPVVSVYEMRRRVYTAPYLVPGMIEDYDQRAAWNATGSLAPFFIAIVFIYFDFDLRAKTLHYLRRARTDGVWWCVAVNERRVAFVVQSTLLLQYMYIDGSATGI